MTRRGPERAGTSSRLIGVGRYAPERAVENAELESQLRLEPGWIARRTGIASRRYAADDEAASDLAVRAGEAALANAGLPRADVALTLLATSTPDHLLPPSAPLVAHRLGLARSGAADLAGACAGFIYALTLGDAFVRTHRRPALVVAANVLSRRINPLDRATAVLFGDAAGAVVLAPSDDPATGVLGVDLASEGARYDLIRVPAGGSRRPFAAGTPASDLLMEMPSGRAVFAHTVAMMTASARRALAAAGLAVDDISRWVPHQANGRICDAVRRALGLPAERAVMTLERYGNSSAASIPFSLAAGAEAAPLRHGERVLLVAAGAGLAGGALVYGC
ncbi:MAG: beta-ketoacyl-ACP synthase III [Acidobacteria bacterium]|nr:beta-ketoacyl-ACP synthase III [Acidobacteriota bacterium]